MRKTISIAIVALSLGLAFGYGLSRTTQTPAPGNDTEPGEKEILYWVAPMDPNFRRDQPGKSPMGMDLVPVYAGQDAGNEDASSLKISAAVVNNLGVRTSIATVADLPREVDTVGFVTMDEDKTAHVHVRTAGWVEKLHRKAVGEQVKKDELIFELYSPELVNAQTEFIQALRLKQAGLIQASKERLRALGMTGTQVNELQQTGVVRQVIDVRAPQEGVILALEIGEGMYIQPAKTVFSLADLSTVWVMAEVFEGQSDWVKAGQAATMRLPFLPGESWEGKVDYVYPIVDPKSRTVKVRLAFANPNGRLKPNMYGEVSVQADVARGVISIPREALIRTGKTDRVILALGEGRFRPAEVIAGRESGRRVEIKAGLSAGETVVTSGQFLIDSEASINSAFLRMLDADTNSAGSSMSNGMASPDEATETAVHHGMGLVNSFGDDGTVNMTHEPIPSLGWPAMTMDFQVAADVDLSVFSPGDRMHFQLQENSQGRLVIITAMKM